MNKTTLANLEKYVKRNVSKFDCVNDPEIRQWSYRYKELEIGYAQDFNLELIYYIKVHGQDVDGIPQQFIEELYDTITQQRKKIKIQSYNNFIKKINKGK